jgi:hypothetical protein
MIYALSADAVRQPQEYSVNAYPARQDDQTMRTGVGSAQA